MVRLGQAEDGAGVGGVDHRLGGELAQGLGPLEESSVVHPGDLDVGPLGIGEVGEDARDGDIGACRVQRKPIVDIGHRVASASGQLGGLVAPRLFGGEIRSSLTARRDRAAGVPAARS